MKNQISYGPRVKQRNWHFNLQTDFVSILVTKIEILAINEGGPNPIRPSFTFLEKVCTVLSMHFAPIEISTERD